MGKKSRRPNRDKPKAASTAGVAAPRQVITSTTDDAVGTFNQLCASQDWAGLLEVESKMNVIAKTFERSNPSSAGSINFYLGSAHKQLGREGAIEEATLYYQKAVEMAKKAGNNVILSEGVLHLSQCYAEMNRVDEAMDAHKSLCDEIAKESMNPNAILSFAEILVDKHEHTRALEIFEEHLEAIERSWGKQEQCRAYEMIAVLYRGKNEFDKSNVYCERQLPIAKATKNVESEFKALHGLGHNFGCMGDYDNAMTYLEQALVIASEWGDDEYRLGTIYSAMGDVLVAQEGREKEGLLMFQKCVGFFEEGSEGLARVFFKTGQAYRLIGAWDDAIACGMKGLLIAKSIEDENLGNKLNFVAKAMEYMGNTFLEKCESLPERNDELIRTALFWSESAYNLRSSGVTLALYLDLAQEHYFLGDSEKAHAVLKKYFDGTVKLWSSHCQACYRTCAKDAIMEKCSVCKVARYCSRAHSIKAWKKDRLCHKVMQLCAHF